MNICLIHKEKNDSSDLVSYLRSSHHVLREVFLQEEELETLARSMVDVIVLDVSSHKGESSDLLFLKKLQDITRTIPVLLVTHATESALYRESMLNAGVDGSIQFPFLKEELFLRLEKLVTKKDTLLFKGTTVITHDVSVNMFNHVVEKKGQELSLTKTEYRILLHLFLHKNALVTTTELSECLSLEPKEDSLSLSIHIYNLRKKIQDCSLIRTIPLYGFTVSDLSSA